jgi:hypothetical protein
VIKSAQSSGKIRRKRQQLKKNHSQIEIGSTVRLRAQSGEIITGQVVHLWEEQSVPMARVGKESYEELAKPRSPSSPIGSMHGCHSSFSA